MLVSGERRVVYENFLYFLLSMYVNLKLFFRKSIVVLFSKLACRCVYGSDVDWLSYAGLG